MTLVLPRRKFLTAAAALFCAPAIVRAASLMPVRSLPIAATLSPQDLDFTVTTSMGDLRSIEYAWTRAGLANEPMLYEREAGSPIWTLSPLKTKNGRIVLDHTDAPAVQSTGLKIR